MGLEVVEHSEHSRLPTLKLPNRSQRSSLLQSELAARTGNSYFRLLAKRDPSSMFINAPGRALHWVPDDYVICADEKTSIQARRRKQPTLPAAPIVPRTSSISTSAWGPAPIRGLANSLPICPSIRSRFFLPTLLQTVRFGATPAGPFVDSEQPSLTPAGRGNILYLATSLGSGPSITPKEKRRK